MLQARAVADENLNPSAPPAKRPYTLSEAALAQRRAASPSGAAAATGPTSDDGKAIASRNAWKHGQHSAAYRRHFDHGAHTLAKTFGKPCLTTCPVHPDNAERAEAPCSLVQRGLTRAGGDCLDKSVYVDAFDAIIESLTTGEYASMHGLLASQVAQAVQLLNDLRRSIAEDGLAMVIPAVTKDGDVIYDRDGKVVAHKYVDNPALFHYTRLLDVLGINLPELLTTPRSQKQAKVGEEQAGAMQSMLGAVMNRFGRGRTLTQDGDEVPDA